MLTSRLRTSSFDDGRERVKRARVAAEELFSPNRQVTKDTGLESPSSERSPRKPRILTISPSVPMRRETVEVSLKQQTMTEIPMSQYARIRTWVKYGMTASQVAQVYGVAVEGIERILRKG